MNSKQFFVLLTIFLLCVVATYYLNVRLNQLAFDVEMQPKQITINNYMVTISNNDFNIEKIEGEGITIGENNMIEIRNENV